MHNNQIVLKVMVKHLLYQRIKSLTGVTCSFSFPYQFPDETLDSGLTILPPSGFGFAFILSDIQTTHTHTHPIEILTKKYSFLRDFRSTLDEYSSELQKVCLSLLKLMAKNLGLDTETISNKYENGTQGMRMNYYPPCMQANKVIGLTPHSDATGLTLLVQVNDVQGLQIKKNNKWIPVKPIPGAIIINIGDVMEVIQPFLDHVTGKSFSPFIE